MAKITVLTGEDNIGVPDNLKVAVSIECVYGDDADPIYNEFAEETMGFIIDAIRDCIVERNTFNTLSILYRRPSERDHEILPFINKESLKTPLLIWNYPENFQHPKRQKRIADYLCTLVNTSIRDYDINIVIVTMSPYIVQGIRYFSNEYKVDVDYYLCEKDLHGKLSGENINNDLNRVFLSFAEPLNEIANIGHKKEESPNLNMEDSSNITD